MKILRVSVGMKDLKWILTTLKSTIKEFDRELTGQNCHEFLVRRERLYRYIQPVFTCSK